jgi:hypothetical protein
MVEGGASPYEEVLPHAEFFRGAFRKGIGGSDKSSAPPIHKKSLQPYCCWSIFIRMLFFIVV